jgi:hypothetical protein
MSRGQRVGSYAARGASMGSVFGPIGAGVGAAGGALWGLMHNPDWHRNKMAEHFGSQFQRPGAAEAFAQATPEQRAQWQQLADHYGFNLPAIPQAGSVPLVQTQRRASGGGRGNDPLNDAIYGRA